MLGLLRCNCALWNRGMILCVLLLVVWTVVLCVHWMDGWVTGLAATADDGGEQWPDVDVGFMLARTLHTASCRMYVDRGKGQVAQWSAVVAVALWRFVCGWGPRGCVGAFCAA